MISRLTQLLVSVCVLALLTGCAERKTIDYTAYKQSRPKSILILPPLNESPDVKATYSMLSQVTYPLAEAGYYVMPVALVDETFRQNGLSTPADIHQLPPNKLHEILVRMQACMSPSAITVRAIWCSAAQLSSPPAPNWWTSRAEPPCGRVAPAPRAKKVGRIKAA